jgi:hypothetical protein
MMRLKLKLANRILNSKIKLVSREKKIFNLDEAQTAGILWETNQDEAFHFIETKLQSSGITTTGLCYSPKRKTVIPVDVQYFTKQQTHLLFEIPKTKVVDDFICQKFDILIDLTRQDSFPVVYTTALSQASFKVGYSGKAVNYFDLNIDFSETPDAGKLAKQILYYLERINKEAIE